MTGAIIITTLLNLVAVYGTIELGIDIMSIDTKVGLIGILIPILLIVAIYYFSLRMALKKKQKRFLIFAFVMSLLILNAVIFRNQIVAFWNEVFCPIGPGSIPSPIELN